VINPEDCNARSNLGNAYYAMSRYSEAMYEYRRAIDIDPKCHSALYNIGVAFADAGLFREAVSWWRKVVQAAPGTDAARNADDNIKILERFIQAPIPPAKRESPKK
jgi:tetratricopeptide (TPR) repeat protein